MSHTLRLLGVIPISDFTVCLSEMWIGGALNAVLLLLMVGLWKIRRKRKMVEDCKATNVVDIDFRKGNELSSMGVISKAAITKTWETADEAEMALDEVERLEILVGGYFQDPCFRAHLETVLGSYLIAMGNGLDCEYLKRYRKLVENLQDGFHDTTNTVGTVQSIIH